MIKINLLPAEKRKAERTPLPRFLLIASTAAAFFILVFYNLFILKLISDVKYDIGQQNIALEKLKPFVKEHDDLMTQKTQLTAKVKEIEDLIHRDTEYWRTVNALWDVIHNNPRVWIDDLRILDVKSAPSEHKRVNPDSKEAVAYGVTMRCHVATDDVTEMTKFRRALKDNLILQETLTNINMNVDWRVDEEKTFEEGHSIGFQISMFGLATKPSRKGAEKPPAPGTPPKAPTTPIKAPAGGAK